MQYSTRGWVALCAVLLSFAGLHAGESQKLAIVNVSKVFENYDKVADVQKKIDAVHDARKKDLEQRGKAIQEENRRLDVMVKQQQEGNGSEELFDLVQRLRKAQFIYERDVAQLNAQIARDYTREMREVLSDIRQAIKAIAEANSVHIVLRSPDTDNPKTRPPDPTKMNDPAEKEKKTYLELVEPQTVVEVLERFHRNPVLYGTKTSDITDDVLKILNLAFMKRSMGGK